MKFKGAINVLSLFLLFSSLQIETLYSQTPPPANMSSSLQSSGTIKGSQIGSPLKHPPQKDQSSPIKLPEIPNPPALVLKQPNYLHPGILVNLNGRWEGSDHLLNLSKNVGVYVTIVKPDNLNLDFSSELIKNEIETILTHAGISPRVLVNPNAPPLPIFEIEIFIYPIEKGFAASCQGRLFESVMLDRFKMDSNMAFQAITWEKQNLIISPKSHFQDQLIKIVKEIASSFAERYHIYDQLKNE